MKRNLIVLILMMCFLAFDMQALKAQSDAFFSNTTELRVDGKTAGEHGFSFTSVDTQQIGFGFEKINDGEEVPLANGMLLMAASGLFYLLTKKRKENK